MGSVHVADKEVLLLQRKNGKSEPGNGVSQECRGDDVLYSMGNNE